MYTFTQQFHYYATLGSNIPFKEEFHDDITQVAPNLKLYPGKNSTAEYTFPLLSLVGSPPDVKLHQRQLCTIYLSYMCFTLNVIL